MNHYWQAKNWSLYKFIVKISAGNCMSERNFMKGSFFFIKHIISPSPGSYLSRTEFLSKFSKRLIQLPGVLCRDIICDADHNKTETP